MRRSVRAENGGLIRPPRRPVGWRAPGPTAPGGPIPRHLQPGAGEDLCHLTGDWRILQRTDGHRWSLDDLATAEFAARTVSHRPRCIADIGCGIGSVLLMMAWRFPEAQVRGVEAQQVSYELARRSIELNGVSDRVHVHRGDLRADPVWEGVEAFDLVTGTPPYLPEGTASESDRMQRGPCRIEHRGGIEDYCRAAAALLAPGGAFVACAGGLDEDRPFDAAVAAGLAVSHRQAVVPRDGKRPLFWVLRMVPGPAASEREDSVLVVRGKDEQWTAPFRRVRHAMGMPS